MKTKWSDLKEEKISQEEIEYFDSQEKNIFENATFGDKFLTRDGRIGLYIHNNEYAELLIIRHDCHLSAYNLDGTLIHTYNPNYDIVSRYQEPINEEKLDEFAMKKSYEVILHDSVRDFCPEYCYELGFKAGYRKAKKE